MSDTQQNFRADSFVSGLAIKAPCVVASNANLDLSGEQTVNGVAVLVGDRVLVIAQTEPRDNGIYNVESSAWNRAGDFDGNRDIVKGTIVTVALASGTDGVNQHYKVKTPNSITVGLSDILFSRADGGGITTAGDEDTSLTAGLSSRTLQYITTLTANRTVTLSTTNAVNGDKFRIVRTALGAFTLDVGGLKTIPNSTTAFVDVEFDGAAWILAGYGVL